MSKSRTNLEAILSEIVDQVKKDLDFDDKRSKITELHQSVPESLKKRLVKVLPDYFFDGDESFEVDNTKMKIIPPDLNAEIDNRMPNLNDILEERDVSVDGVLNLMQQAYQEVHLKGLDDDEQERKQSRRWNEKKVNWIADYVKKLKRHRVQWDSKLYRDNPKNWQKKSMIENVEMMIDLSAAEFAEWCNSLASEDRAKTVTPELIKQLFSIETEGSAPRGLHVEPAELYVLPSAVIEKFDENSSASHLDLEYKMNRIRKRDNFHNSKPEREHAFGRSLPKELKQKKRRGLTREIKPVFPEDLQSKETLFKGIEHLQVTRNIFDHISREDQTAVPDYLRKNSLFNRNRPA